MKIKFDAAFKNRRVVAVIVVGAIVIAIPIFIFQGSIRALWSAVWDDFTSWAGLRKPVVSEKFSRLAESSNRPPQAPPAGN